MQKNLAFIKNRLSALWRGVNTSLRLFTGGSDYQRWANRGSLSPNWDSRTEKIAKLVDPGTSVIEFGAGRLVLKTSLPSDCSYTPSDIVDRGHGTIVCDLNSDPLPHFKSYDVAVFSGVLEYINDLPKLIFHLSNFVNVIVASYAVTDTINKNRRESGWVNDYTSEQFIDVFRKAGFQCSHSEEWGSQIIYRFRQSESEH